MYRDRSLSILGSRLSTLAPTHRDPQSVGHQTPRLAAGNLDPPHVGVGYPVSAMYQHTPIFERCRRLPETSEDHRVSPGGMNVQIVQIRGQGDKILAQGGRQPTQAVGKSPLDGRL
jgi:hypothetical protein